MNHFTSPDFWQFFNDLPPDVQDLWSVRVGRRYRALATEVDDGMLWGWIGSHAEYERIIES